MMLGGLEGDEREQLQQLICHFVNRLNEERALSADLARRLAVAEQRVSFLEAAHYGFFS